tara:strand:+ start:191 stop:409 length:219 start_codon:yes stop_codon:yes gene_type:complete
MKNVYSEHKDSIYKWRNNNLVQYREQQRLYQQKHYKEIGYTDKVKQRKKTYYLWKSERNRQLTLLCSLVDDE